MEKNNIKNMIKGWFIGNFNPSLFRTKQFEVGYKTYSSGDHEKKHLHKVATEFTLIISGEVLMNNQKFFEGDIIKIEPGEATDFKALTDVKTIVIKIPSVEGDKYVL